MRTLIVVITTATMLMSGAIWSQETDPARQIAEQWQAEQALRAEREARLNELMSIMAEEMEAIHEEDERGQKQQLLAIHRAHMHEAMELMRDLGGASIPREQISDASRLGDLETRVDMMQIMLESMMAEQTER